MATRFYLSSTASAAVAPGFAAWTDTASAARHTMSPTKDGSTNQGWGIGFGAEAANASVLALQFVSAPLAAGIVFTTADTVKLQAAVVSLQSGSNWNRQPLCLKVYSQNGSTLQATLLALGNYGPSTTAWNSSSLTNRTFADGDTLSAGYTTVTGDRLVLEVGGQVDATGSASALGSIGFGSSSGTDLGQNETDVTGNPWFEISTAITFPLILTGQSAAASAGRLGVGPVLLGQGASMSAGTLAAGNTLQGQAASVVGNTAAFFAGVQRGYLSWVQLATQLPTGTVQALTGQSAATAAGTFPAVGASRGYLSWTRVTTPLPSAVNITLLGAPVAATAGIAAPVGGTFLGLTGQVAAATAGTLIQSGISPLTGIPLLMSAGTVGAIQDNFAFAGFATPLITVGLTASPLAAGAGSMTALTPGNTTVPLIGMSSEIDAAVLPVAPSDFRGAAMGSSVGIVSPLAEIPAVGVAAVADVGVLQTQPGVVVLTGCAAAASSNSFFVGGVLLTGQESFVALGDLAVLGWDAIAPSSGVWTNVTPSSGAWSRA